VSLDKSNTGDSFFDVGHCTCEHVKDESGPSSLDFLRSSLSLQFNSEFTSILVHLVFPHGHDSVLEHLNSADEVLVMFVVLKAINQTKSLA